MWDTELVGFCCSCLVPMIPVCHHLSHASTDRRWIVLLRSCRQERGYEVGSAQSNTAISGTPIRMRHCKRSAGRNNFGGHPYWTSRRSSTHHRFNVRSLSRCLSGSAAHRKCCERVRPNSRTRFTDKSLLILSYAWSHEILVVMTQDLDRTVDIIRVRLRFPNCHEAG